MLIKSAFCGLLVVLVIAGCSDNSNEQVIEEKPVVVQLAEVKTAITEHEFSFPAKVKAKTTVDLSFRINGRLKSIYLPEGKEIKKGQIIAQLEPEPFERAVRMAEVKVKQAELELKRVKAIAIKGIGSEKSVDNAQVNFELAEIELEIAKANLEYSVLKAPFDALVAKRLIENKGFIKTGVAIARLQDLSRIHFKFDIPERLINAYSRSQVAKATAFMDGAINKEFEIEFVEYSTEPDPISQTYGVVYAMDAPKGVEITPGIYATVKLSGSDEDLPQALGVPVNALVTGANEEMAVWVYDPTTERISNQVVTVGSIIEGWVVILSGLEKGQKVVSAGVNQMKEGLLVRPYSHQ
ncbi:efflux RND transporter periplasmic adaptor subunit [Oceaniserpentilla sp. 4NH20-0058]|uniref:efflux RND transporter periplasmic adaptor subunit n=1 Tax=Oceaniserpentilla sp. 4NH20-0058 TaxID=3127660 RepID=UPI003104E72F